MAGRAVLATAILVLAMSPLASAGAASDNPSPPAVNQAAGHGDRDGDHVDDAFQKVLRKASGGAKFAVIVTGEDVAGAQRAVGHFAVRRSLPLIDGFSATMTAGQALGLARRPGVRRVEQVSRVQAVDDGTDRDFGASQVPIDHPGVTGAGVGLCVVDTGVDPTHEQIAPRAVSFFDAINSGAAAYDDHGHGTHVTSIAAGDGTGGASASTFKGVAPGATLHAAKVLDASGNGDSDQVVAGTQWCTAQSDVQVISMSLGDTIGGDGTDALSLAVNAAVAGGDLVVVAAGNSGDLRQSINAPGTATGALTVGAVSEHSNPVGAARHDDGIFLAAFSSRGPTSDGRTKPDLVAPGLSVTAASAGSVSGYTTLSGTSMATPYVAGAAVLARQANPAAPVAQVRAALAGTARDVGAVGTDNEYGAGLVDVRAAVDTVLGVSPARTTAFPQLSRVTASVPSAGSVDIPIVVPTEAVGLPLALTLTINSGGPNGQCDPFFGCLFVEWSPDLDMELRSPSGSVLAVSECTLDGLSCGNGRQETIGIRPSVAGTHVLHVYAWQGAPGGTVSVDISMGPVGAAAPPPPPPSNLAPSANAGADRTIRTNKKTSLAAFTLDGSLSKDPDGSITSYSWLLDGSQVGTTARLPQSKGIGVYTYTLVVTDDDGATASDSVKITVRR